MVSTIMRELESLGETEITTDTIGENVMTHLRELDDVAYVRFASVYKNFREPKDFQDAVHGIVRRRRSQDRPAAAQVTTPADDLRFMQLALTLGRRGLGNAWPNPAVGAVIVKDGAVIGARLDAAGRPAACRDRSVAACRPGRAWRDTLRHARALSHHGKTPPCAEAIVAAGIARVVSAIEDPNPEVAGRGDEMLRASGIVVTTGVCAEDARRPRRSYLPYPRWPPARHAEARGVLGRQGRPIRTETSADHRRGDAGACAPDARDE